MMTNLPKSHLKSSRGQILIIFLLILVVAAAIVLSVASRTITDIKTTTTSDESNRAYFAAEAGVEEALRSLQSGSLNFSNVNATATITVNPSGGGDTFVYPNDVGKDEVVQLTLLRDFTKAPWDPTNAHGWDADLIFYWGVPNSTITPAIEVSVVYYCPNGTCPGYSPGQNWGISKIAFDPVLTRGNGFCSGNSVTELTSPDNLIGDRRFHFSTEDVSLYRGVESCGTPTSPTGTLKLTDPYSTIPVLARIRLLYNSSQPSPLAVEVTGESYDSELPPQGRVIESTGQTASGVTRKLQVIRLYTALPALFDYVLFNGGCKTFAAGVCTEYYPLQK